mgnify:CR=1 FL=1
MQKFLNIFEKILRNYRIKGGNKRNILFWGPKNSIEGFFDEISSNTWMGYEITYWFSPVKNDKGLRIKNVFSKRTMSLYVYFLL